MSTPIPETCSTWISRSWGRIPPGGGWRAHGRKRVLVEGAVPWHAAVLLGAFVLLTALALAAFEAREIGTGHSPLRALLRRERRAATGRRYLLSETHRDQRTLSQAGDAVCSTDGRSPHHPPSARPLHRTR